MAAKTMQDIAKSALNAQDACNLSGLVFAFAEMMHVICAEAHANGHGTDWRNSHPICTVMLNKMSQLAGADSLTQFQRAYEAVKQMAEGDTLPAEGGK